MGGISIWQLLIVAVIVILLFGTKKLRNIGGDLGSAIKGFKKAMVDDDKKDADKKDADFVPEKLEEKNNTVQNSEIKEKDKDKDKEQV